MIRRIFLLTGSLLILAMTTVAQDKFFTKNGKINFVSKGAVETIEASHKSVTCVLDSKTGNIQFSVLMKGFEFKKALMQEHFNENYVESDKFPKAEFKGQIANNADVNYAKDGTYNVKVKGKLTLHGETKDVETSGTITVSGGKPTANSEFNVQMSDYKIAIPSVVKDHMDNNVKITVNCALEPLGS